ncbi:MAG: heparinase [Enterovirga sp.]|nr:heparinase [Enterovirga sp.]
MPLAWLRRNARGPGWRVPQPDRLLFAPQDLRTSDPTIASDVYGGLFVFAGKAVESRGQSPFELVPPSSAWSRALYGFDWLRHLRAAGSALAREHARALVAEAVGPRRGDLERGTARETRVVARRLISFLCQSPLVLNGADRNFYAAFLRAIGRCVASLERDAVSARTPLDRLAAAIALCYAALCCSGFETRLRRATRLLSAEIEAQILPDGGHVSRNPGVLVDLLLDLLPLRLLYASRSLETPDALVRAIDRMMPMLRYLRAGGSELALFNGMGPTAADQVATLLSYDTVRGAAPAYAEASGYLRLQAGETVLIADTGRAPPVESGRAAHAGCLSFELSVGGSRMVVNAGISGEDPARQGARRTAAHSTLSLGDRSSALFITEVPGPIGRWLRSRLGPALVRGPTSVMVERRTEPDGSLSCTASHDGYGPSFGATHERRWLLAPDGFRLDGTDTLTLAGDPGGLPRPVLRFHLSPVIGADLDEAGSAVVLSGPEGQRWRFAANGARLAVEDSLYLGGPEGWRPSRQIVVRMDKAVPGGSITARWSFVRDPV